MKSIILLLCCCALTACSTSQENILPSGDQTMLALWSRQAGGEQRLLELRSPLRRPLLPAQQITKEQERYTRTAENEAKALFPRLPNPDMVMYIYPHLAGDNSAPVPGYSTVFSFYRQVQYALPGERLEAL